MRWQCIVREMKSKQIREEGDEQEEETRMQFPGLLLIAGMSFHHRRRRGVKSSVCARRWPARLRRSNAARFDGS